MRERDVPAHSAAQVQVPRTHIKVNERTNCTELSPDSTYVPWYTCSCTYIVQPHNNNKIKKKEINTLDSKNSQFTETNFSKEFLDREPWQIPTG